MHTMHTCIYFVIIFSYFCELWTFVIYDPNSRQGKDQVIRVDRMKWLQGQRIVGEADDDVITEHVRHTVKEESGSDEPSVKEDKYDDPVNDFSDLPTIPCARSGQQGKKPAWHADYEM